MTGCTFCDSDDGEHPNWDRIILIDGKPFCIDSRARLLNGDNELDEEGDRQLTEAETNALLDEKIEPVGKDKQSFPDYPWDPKSWRIVKPRPAEGAT